MTPIAIKKLIVNKNMKHYNFDEVIERHGTSCVKFDRLKEMFGDENLIPLWVADMDFRTPDFIVEALKKRCEHEIFGYTFGSDEYYESIINWVHYKHNWKIQREWIAHFRMNLNGDNQNIVLGANLGQSDQGFLFPDDPARIVRVAEDQYLAFIIYNRFKMIEIHLIDAVYHL